MSKNKYAVEILPYTNKKGVTKEWLFIHDSTSQKKPGEKWDTRMLSREHADALLNNLATVQVWVSSAPPQQAKAAPQVDTSGYDEQTVKIINATLKALGKPPLPVPAPALSVVPTPETEQEPAQQPEPEPATPTPITETESTPVKHASPASAGSKGNGSALGKYKRFATIK